MAVRDPFVLKVRLIQTIIAALLTGLVYGATKMSQSTIMNYNGALFSLVCNMNWLYQYSAVELFCFEMPIFLREYQSGLYSAGAYFFAKNLAELPQYIILPFIFVCILYWTSGFIANLVAFAWCSFISILMANVAISIAYAMSCIFGNEGVAANIMPVFVMPTLAVAGFFINRKFLPPYLSIFKYISYFGFTYESLAINEWVHVSEIPGCQNGTYCVETGFDVLESMDFSPSHFYPDIIGLVFLFALIRTVAFIALYVRARRGK